MTNQEIARIAHEANRAYCRTLGDDSQPEWDVAPEWQRASAIAGVEAVRMKPTLGPEGSHRSWMEHKLADGWTYGEAKDTTRRTHPCLRPWDELPVEQRRKDVLFLAVVKACLWEGV